jgi:hypothetical protein
MAMVVTVMATLSAGRKSRTSKQSKTENGKHQITKLH